MIAKHTLQKAVNEKIISSEQLEPLYQFFQDEALAAEANNNPDNREEPLKFIRSFGDVFITLGVVLLAISMNMANLSGLYSLLPIVGFIVVAEWLVRVRRLALPGMAILIALLFFVNNAIVMKYGSTTSSGFAVLSGFSLLFYLRYKMPFSLLPLAAGLVALAILQLGIDTLKSPIIFAILGLIIFAAALWFDSKDTKRISHMSDSGFWLHLLAAPLIVHGIMMSLLLSNQAWLENINKEVFIFGFFAMFFLLALLVDRRAMLISTQLYVIYALTQLLQDKLTNTQDVMIFIFIGLGLFVIYFGAYWYKTRRLIFGRLSGSAISQYVPDFNIQDIKR